jgi:hypothetical protein
MVGDYLDLYAKLCGSFKSIELLFAIYSKVVLWLHQEECHPTLPLRYLKKIDLVPGARRVVEALACNYKTAACGSEYIKKCTCGYRIILRHYRNCILPETLNLEISTNGTLLEIIDIPAGATIGCPSSATINMDPVRPPRDVLDGRIPGVILLNRGFVLAGQADEMYHYSLIDDLVDDVFVNEYSYHVMTCHRDWLGL